jgi:hypothetical protein
MYSLFLTLKHRLLFITQLEVISRPVAVIGQPQKISMANIKSQSQQSSTTANAPANLPMRQPNSTPIKTENVQSAPPKNFPNPNMKIKQNLPNNGALMNNYNNNNQNSLPTQITPIHSLNPYHQRWMIRARVTCKSEMKSWNSEKGQGCLFTVDLMDEVM